MYTMGYIAIRLLSIKKLSTKLNLNVGALQR